MALVRPTWVVKTNGDIDQSWLIVPQHHSNWIIESPQSAFHHVAHQILILLAVSPIMDKIRVHLVNLNKIHITSQYNWDEPIMMTIILNSVILSL